MYNLNCTKYDMTNRGLTKKLKHSETLNKNVSRCVKTPLSVTAP